MDDQHTQYQFQSDNQWYGRVNSHQPGALYDKSDGLGLFNHGCTPPEECEDFILDQMARFGFQCTRGLAAWGAQKAFDFLDRIDPYILFTRKLSDVNVSEEWTAHTYEISRKFGGKGILVKTPPGKAESYRLDVRQGEEAYRKFMVSDRLVYDNALKVSKHPVGDIAHSIHREVVQELGYSDKWENVLGDGVTSELWYSFVNVTPEFVDVEPDIGWVHHRFGLSAWAGLVWLLSPLSAGWRSRWCDLIGATHRDGEAIVYQRNVFARGQYKKIQIPGGHCYHENCQIQSWCLTDTLDGRSLGKICEHCATLGAEPLPPANCGFQLCRMPQCKHHPFFAFDPDRRLHETMRAHGQLTKKDLDPALAGNQIPQILLT